MDSSAGTSAVQLRLDEQATLYFLDAATGDTVGTLLQPRPQTSFENWHLAQLQRVVPTDKRYVLVSSSYQAGTSVIEFTDPANPREIAYAGAPLSETSLVEGGDWSTRAAWSLA